MAGLKIKMTSLETKFTAQIGDLKSELIAKIGNQKTDTIKWLISLQFGLLALTVGPIYFLLNDFLLRR